MAAYVIVDVEVLDPELYKEYTSRVPATLTTYGGRFLVRGGRYETLEGTWQPRRIVVLEFDSYAAAMAWYRSPEYQEIVPLRQKYARTNFLTVVEGTTAVEPPA
jgi:uncharacterized protein (DUF1330 family)